MVVTNNGLGRITTLVSNDIDNGQAGTGTTLAVEDDTSLETPVAATKLALTKEIGTRVVSVTHVISSTVATGNNFTEWETRMNSDGTTLSRSITAAITHTAADEITRITSFFLTQG